MRRRDLCDLWRHEHRLTHLPGRSTCTGNAGSQTGSEDWPGRIPRERWHRSGGDPRLEADQDAVDSGSPWRILALNFSRTCTAAIKQAGVLDDIEIRCAVDLPLDNLLEHRSACPTCSIKQSCPCKVRMAISDFEVS